MPLGRNSFDLEALDGAKEEGSWMEEFAVYQVVERALDGMEMVDAGGDEHKGVAVVAGTSSRERVWIEGMQCSGWKSAAEVTSPNQVLHVTPLPSRPISMIE